MQKIVQFFKTSPRTKGEIFSILIGFGILAGMFIVGGIYQFTTNPKDIGTISFILVGIIFLTAGIGMINPKMFFKGVVQELPPDNDNF
jgi:hypothetical protein